MKEFVEKLIERLEEEKAIHTKFYRLSEYREFPEVKTRHELIMHNFNKTIEIVNQLAEEYKGGWIPCSERLPDKSGWFLCTQEYHSLTNGNLIKVTTELVEFYDNKWRRAKNLVVTHWQPLPEPYQPKGE